MRVLGGTLAALLLLGGPISVTPSAGAAAPGVNRAKFGIATGGKFVGMSEADRRSDLDGMADMGAKWLRLGFDWNGHQPDANGTIFYERKLDIVDDARAEGLKVVGMLAYAPDWAADPGCLAINRDGDPLTPQLNCSPAADKVDEFGAYAGFMAGKFAGKVDHWEIWNEQGSRGFWGPGANPARYAATLRAAYGAIHRANPNTVVISGGLATKQDTVNGTTLSPHTFTEQMYAADPTVPFDAFAIHPYYACCSPMKAAEVNPFYNLNKLHQRLANHGDGDKKLWITEFGYETPPLSEETKALWMNIALDQVAQWDYVAVLFLFNYRDFGTEEFGFLNENGTVKAARGLVKAHALAGYTDWSWDDDDNNNPPNDDRSKGYWLLGADGGIFTYGNAKFFGSTGGMRLNQPVLGLAPTKSGKGYWLAASDGGTFTFGDAGFFGSTGNIRLNKPIVSMTATPSGKGYWLVAPDGGVFTFGDAKFYGSTGDIRLNKPIVTMAPTASGKGYWLIASDGGVFTFGDAKFYGSTGDIRLNKPITHMNADPSGKGYRLLATDGGTFQFGQASFFGSLAGPGAPAAESVAMLNNASNDGYWIVTRDGGVYPFGDAENFGGANGTRLNAPIVGAARTP